MPDALDTLTVRPASDVAPDALAAAFNAAYEGYLVPIHMTAAMLEAHVAHNDIALDRSRVAEAPDGTLVGVGLLGVRAGRGWIGGVGVAPAWRGKGWGAALMRALIDEARDAGLFTLQLEVLEHNTVARHLYERLGFVVTRSLAIFTGPLADVPAPAAPGESFASIPVADALATLAQLRPHAPPWQREPATLARMAATTPAIQAVALMRDGHVQAALLAAIARDGALTLFDLGARATAPEDRRDDTLALLAHLLADRPGATVRAVNIAPGEPLYDALTALGCPVVMRQHEMLLDLFAMTERG